LARWKKRTHGCGELRKEHVGRDVTLNGWVHRIRDHGDLVFINLRDRTGITQIVVRADDVERLGLRDVKSEYVLSVTGPVHLRQPGAENPAMPTGDIELEAREIEVLNTCKVLPFPVSDERQMQSVNEELRIKHRYIDLRRPSMYERLEVRHKVVKLIRDFLHERGFLEVETPIMTKATPEGARDYVVPYRLAPGKFYALPQSPQQYKQLLMVGGVERYFQIARCFRDEAQRADRQPEFTQLDLEMSFVEQEDILSLTEELTSSVVRQLSNKEMLSPWPRLTYDEAMERFGTDKPDLRFGLELKTLNDLVADSEFAVFRSVLDSGGVVRAVRYPGGASLSRREIEELVEFAKSFGAKGMAYLALTDEGAKGAAAKHLSEERIAEIARRCEAENGDLVCIVADAKAVADEALARLRVEIGSRCDLRDPSKLYFCFITDFPLVLWNEEEQRWDSSHHPFTMPHEEDLPLFDSDPGRIRAQCYDVVCNGVEWASGSIRIHRRDIQAKVFDLLGIDAHTQVDRFGHMLEAFEYGAPPHGGIAPGIDRLVMFLMGDENIREVIAFPKIAAGYDPLMDSPAPIQDEQWEELGLALRETAPKDDGGQKD